MENSNQDVLPFYKYNNMEELVFAFPTDEFWKLTPYKIGLIKENCEVLKRIVQNGLFLRRSELEEDPSFKQIIPYAIISNKEPKRNGARRSQIMRAQRFGIMWFCGE
jgi:hypothetical protein